MLAIWKNVSVEKKHPEKVTTVRAMALFNDTCLTRFRNILKGRQKQRPLESFLLICPAVESDKTMIKRRELLKK